jgi:hypothetical protein
MLSSARSGRERILKTAVATGIDIRNKKPVSS